MLDIVIHFFLLEKLLLPIYGIAIITIVIIYTMTHSSFFFFLSIVLEHTRSYTSMEDVCVEMYDYY